MSSNSTDYSYFEALPDYAILDIMHTLNDIELMQVCMLNKRTQRLCGYSNSGPGSEINPDGPIYDLSLKARIDKYKKSIQEGDYILIKDIQGYYPIVSNNSDVIQYAMENIQGYNPHLFFIKLGTDGYKIGMTMLHTGAGLFFSASAPDLGNFYESTFTGVSRNNNSSDNIVNHFLKNGYYGIIGFIKDNQVHYFDKLRRETYSPFKYAIEHRNDKK